MRRFRLRLFNLADGCGIVCGLMSPTGSLFSFYTEQQHAAEALRQLRRGRIRRVALIHRGDDGRLQVDAIAARDGAVWGGCLGLLAGVVVGLLLWGPGDLFTAPRGYLMLALATLAGAALGWVLVRLLGLSVDRALVEKHAPRLMAGETVVVVQASSALMSQAITVLRRASVTPPSIFAFHPRRAETGEKSPIRDVPAIVAKLGEHARHLAALDRTEVRRRGGEPVLGVLDRAELVIEEIRRELAESYRLEQRVSSSAEWILDNAHIVQAQIDDVRLNLPKNFYHELPVFISEPREPRIYRLAAELVGHTDGQLDRHTIGDFFEAYQERVALTIGELWALPLMLRIVLIDRIRWLAEELDQNLCDRQEADYWANRLLMAARRDPNQIFAILADLSRQQPEPSTHFAFQLTGHLYDEEAAVVPVVSWLERKLANTLGEVVLAEQARQAAAHASIGNAVTSLRQLTLLDWREIFEDQSRVERTLAEDPAGVYARMDFDTRNRYRCVVEELSRSGGIREGDVAAAALELAAEAGRDRTDGGPHGHVGYYLIGPGRRRLVERLGIRETLRHRVLERIYRHHTGLYLGAIGGLTLAAVGAAGLAGLEAGASPLFAVLTALVALLPASQIAVRVVNYALTRLLPPRLLPKMSFEEEGIPDEFRTLVVVPMLLVNELSLRQNIERLEIRYLGNPDPNLVFGLFSDYTAAAAARIEGDEEILRLAIGGIEALNERYGENRFYLFHRERVWTESEQCFIGWERKRGKIEALNRLLAGEAPSDGESIVHVGDPDRLADVRFVITLDSDTQLPRDTARRMVETLAHPLNRPHPDPETNPDAYTIIQPRVTTTLTAALTTPFTRLFTDPVGTDPYTKAVSDVYQDLSGEGSYIGKGIYDPRTFHRVLGGRFPEQRLLSHDLIEGAHTRVGLASDIELLDDFPPEYLSYTHRQHRWIRGDWQIADWCLPRVPGPHGKRVANPLGPLNRWKILDNLRRSLVPASLIVFLVFAWFSTPVLALVASAAVGLLMAFPLLAGFVTTVTTPRGKGGRSWREFAHDGLRALVETAFLPHQACSALDAICRVFYRRLVSGRHLLQWTTAQATPSKVAGRTWAFLASLVLISLVAAGLGAALYLRAPEHLVPAAPFLALWLLSPVAGWRLNRKPSARPGAKTLSASETSRLRETARKTWRYFGDFVGPDSSWLPPDNFQVSFGTGLALRTSPTNIGLWLLGAVSAHDLGFVTIDETIGRIRHTLATIGKLERYNGHLLNWYDLKTLQPMEPRYVSTVDSGNLLASLWTLGEGLREIAEEPIIGPRALDALHDTLRILRKAADGGRQDGQFLDQLDRLFSDPPERLDELIRRLRRAVEPARLLANSLRQNETPPGEATYWAEEIERQVASWITVVERYLGWVELLADQPEEKLGLAGPAAVEARRRALAEAPTLGELARGGVTALGELLARHEGEGDRPRPLEAHLQTLEEATAKARWLAGEVYAHVEEALSEIRALGDGMKMEFLYDRDRRLFTIGFNVREQRLDASYYDLLASEARLGSFIAIARGDVPNDHWLAMARPLGSVHRRRVLLSWSGTMFEYLMPLLMQKSFPNSLLEDAARQAVLAQRGYARKLGIPWGMSEAAFSDLDASKNYQYQAFGVPDLGLKRGLENELVVAPYATLLALAVDPRAAVANLGVLERLGLYGPYGFRETIDFSRQRHREGEAGVIVDAYMAHHQAMGLLAIDNCLNGGAMQRRFHADPRVRATEPLLYERIPVARPVYQAPLREQSPSRIISAEDGPSASIFDTPHTPAPKTQLLSNGRYALMVTNAGGGYSRWGDFELTRWRSDGTTDGWGTFCYLQDAETRRIWSNAYQPVRGRFDNYTVNFAVDRAEIRRSDDGIETETEIIVAPEDDVEIRRIALINRSDRPRDVEITSYVELALAPHDADRQHPAFNKLFIETAALREHGALLATRRPRDAEEQPIWLVHLLTAPTPGGNEEVEFETDRRRFIGRGRTPENPVALTGALSNTAGQVLDPIFSLRRRAHLEPSQRVDFSLVLGAVATRDEALTLIAKYNDPHAISRQVDLAWSHAQLELRHLRIHPDEARRIQQLAAAMLFPGSQLRPSGERIRKNRLGQSRLWPYGISGDLPIAVVTIGESRDISLVRQVLQAHACWRLHGLRADLVILNEEASTYETPLNDQLKRLIQSYSVHTGVDVPGGVFLRHVDQIPEEDVTLLLAAARVVLVAARGSLSQQLAMPTEFRKLPARLKTRFVEQEPSAPLLFRELHYFNGLGGFTTDGREYAIYLGPRTWTPAPWVNVISNPTFGTLVSESGSGFTWSGNSQQNRLTAWSNDPVGDPPSEAVYIRDEENGFLWSPTPLPIRELDAYRARHGAGYTVFEHNSHAIEQELTVFVPMDDGDGDPVCLKRLRLRNDGSRIRRLSVTFYAEWTLGDHCENTHMHIVTEWDDASQAILARNRYHSERGDRVAFATLAPPPHSTSADRLEFLGRNGTMAAPAAMRRGWLSGRTGAKLDPCAALQIKLDLSPGDTTEVTFLLGQTGSVEESREVIARYRDGGAVEKALERTQAWWDHAVEAVQVTTPELSTNLLVNRWLLYQTLSCRIWGRSGLYQSGGAFGFRDQLQDVLALLYSMPQLAREHIERACGRQFREGDVQHWWHPLTGVGVRSRCSDDLLWLPFAVARYVRVTGDTELLDTRVPFIDAPTLKESEHEIVVSPTVTSEHASVYEHCRLAIERGLTRGPRGLPLIGTGDWNDGMNRIGIAGKGESVWLAWFLVDVLTSFSDCAESHGRPDDASRYRAKALELARTVEEEAWDGAWWRRAYFDDGTPVGSAQSAEARIDSLPQSWAVISGAADPERAARALESVREHLVREDERLVLLFTPPFDSSEVNPGYIKGYPPGVRENGGQYTHAALWLAFALARRGDGDTSVSLLRLVNPIEQSREPHDVARYQVEPYVVAADIYRLPGRVGQGGWTWYTGSAGWMYRVWIEEVLGLRVRGDQLTIHPVLPSSWEAISVSYRRGKAVYEISVENPDNVTRGVAWIEEDGRRLHGNAILLEDAPVKHRILVRMGRRAERAAKSSSSS